MKQKIIRALRVLKAYMPDWMVAFMRNFFDKKMQADMMVKYKQVKPYDVGKYDSGINLIGNIRSETGLGESMRILARTLKKCDIPFVIVNVDNWANSDNGVNDWDDYIVDEPVYSHNLIHVNANVWAKYYNEFPLSWLDYRYNVAYWLWELETFPDIWMPCIETVDAIWAPSEFICDCFNKYTDKPVVHVPYAIELKEPVKYDRSYFDLPDDKFLYLLMYDFRSVSERKNPSASVEAFKMAFSAKEANDNNVGIVLKINNAATDKEVNALKQRLDEYDNVYFITENLSRDGVESLEAVADVLISLHRAEGFGLPMAEAMYLGTPTVVTNWSANSEFVDENSACLVNGQFVTLDKQVGPYEKGSRWMDADVKEASRYIRRLFDDKDYYEKIKAGGKKHVREVLSYDRAGNIIREQLI